MCLVIAVLTFAISASTVFIALEVPVMGGGGLWEGLIWAVAPKEQLVYLGGSIRKSQLQRMWKAFPSCDPREQLPF